MKYKRIFTYCIIGTTLEWYDFALFGVLSPLLSQIFFPHQTKAIALILALAVFAAGYVMRPLGAIFFGHIGDRYGRKPAIIWSIMAMTVATVAMGLLPILPTHAVAVALILVTLRLVQGFAVSGESSGVATFLSELVPMHDRRYFFKQGFIWSGAMIGALMGSIIGGLAFSFNHQYAFAWRLPFLLSVFLGVIGLYFRLKAIETPLFKRIMDAKETVKLPIKEALTSSKMTIAVGVLLALVCVSYMYLLILVVPIKFAPHHIVMIQIIVLSTLVIIAPFFAYFATNENAQRMVFRGLCLFVLLPIPLLWLLSNYNTLTMLIVVSVLLALSYACFQSIVHTFVILLYPHNVRYTAMGLAMNAAIILTGCFPLLSTVIMQKTGSILPAAGIISLIALAVALLLFALRHKIFSVHNAQIRVIVKS